MTGIDRAGNEARVQRLELDRAPGPSDNRQIGHSSSRPVVTRNTPPDPPTGLDARPARLPFPVWFTATLDDGNRMRAFVPERRTGRLGAEVQNQMIHAMKTQNRAESKASDSLTYPGGEKITYATWPEGADRSDDPSLHARVETQAGHVREVSVTDFSRLDSTSVVYFYPPASPPPDPSRPLSDGRSPFSSCPPEVVLNVASRLSVSEQRALARTGRAMAVPLLPQMRRLEDLAQALDHFIDDLMRPVSALTQDKLDRLSNAVNDSALVPEQKQELMEAMDEAFKEWAQAICPLEPALFDQHCAKTTQWPAELQEAGLEALAKESLKYILDDCLRKFDAILDRDVTASDTGMRLSTLQIGPRFGAIDRQVLVMQGHLQQVAARPPAFQSIALRGALKKILWAMPHVRHPSPTMGDQSVRTVLFDAVSTQADRLPEKYREQVRAALRDNVRRLPEGDRESRRQALRPEGSRSD